MQMKKDVCKHVRKLDLILIDDQYFQLAYFQFEQLFLIRMHYRSALWLESDVILTAA